MIHCNEIVIYLYGKRENVDAFHEKVNKSIDLFNSPVFKKVKYYNCWISALLLVLGWQVSEYRYNEDTNEINIFSEDIYDPSIKYAPPGLAEFHDCKIIKNWEVDSNSEYIDLMILKLREADNFCQYIFRAIEEEFNLTLEYYEESESIGHYLAFGAGEAFPYKYHMHNCRGERVFCRDEQAVIQEFKFCVSLSKYLKPFKSSLEFVSRFGINSPEFKALADEINNRILAYGEDAEIMRIYSLRY